MVRWIKAALVAPLFVVLSFSQVYASSGKVGSLNPHLKSILSRIENHFRRPLSVTSGCRSRHHNDRIGGAHESWHLRCMAADFKMEGVNKYTAAKYAGSLSGRGGIGTYCSDSSVHVDLGPRREWNWCGRHRSFHQGLIHPTMAFHFQSRHKCHFKQFKKHHQRYRYRHHRCRRRF